MKKYSASLCLLVNFLWGGSAAIAGSLASFQAKVPLHSATNDARSGLQSLVKRVHALAPSNMDLNSGAYNSFEDLIMLPDRSPLLEPSEDSGQLPLWSG